MTFTLNGKVYRVVGRMAVRDESGALIDTRTDMADLFSRLDSLSRAVGGKKATFDSLTKEDA